jgi:hypothetical protein
MKRRVLVAVLLLVDASIPPQQIDLDCANWLAEAQVRITPRHISPQQQEPPPAAAAAGIGCLCHVLRVEVVVRKLKHHGLQAATVRCHLAAADIHTS